MKAQKRTNSSVGEGPNWMLIAGGALLSSLSMRFGYKLKQVIDSKQQRDNINNNSATTTSNTNGLKGNENHSERTKSGYCQLHSNVFCFQDEDGCFNCLSGTEGVIGEMKNHQNQRSNGQLVTRPEISLPMVTTGPTEYNNSKENGVMWQSSPDRLDLPQKPFHRSNSSDSPCVSDSGSDIFSKKEVIQKLRQQLKRRDDMILEMQDQISDLHSSLTSQASHSSHIQALLDESNRDLFNSEREIQRLRKAIADHCVGPSYGDADMIEMLKRENGELKEVIEGRDYLLKSQKEQNTQLLLKIQDLQKKLDSQLPNIL